MFCHVCGTQNAEGSNFCSKCGTNLGIRIRENETFKHLDMISTEIEKLHTLEKIGFYITGFILLAYFSIFTLFIGPIIVYFWGKRGWPRNSLVKAVLYYQVYLAPIFFVGAIILIVLSVIAAFVYGMGPVE